MKARILYILFCGAMFFCSTPFAFAREACAEAGRTDFSSAADVEYEDDRLAAVTFGDAGLVSVQIFAEQSETSADGEEEARREQRRTISFLKFYSHNCFTGFLSAKKLSKGVAKHPATQDAGQERTKAVRFLRIAALAC